MLAVVIGAACLAESTVLFKIVPKSQAITTNAAAMAVRAVILFVMSVIWSATAMMPKMPSTWVVVGYLIVFGPIGVFVLALYVLARWMTSATSYSLVRRPIMTVLLGAWPAHETVTLGFLIDGVIVLAGVYIGAVRRRNSFPAGGVRT